MNIINKLLVGCLLVILSTSLVFATVGQVEEISQEEAFVNFMTELDSEINGFEGQELPGVLSPFVSDETLEVVLTLNSGDEVKYIFVIEDSVIKQAEQGDLEEPGYVLIVSQDFVEANSGDAFGKAIRDGLTTGEVTYEANGLWRKIKLSIMLAAVDVAAMFN